MVNAFKFLRHAVRMMATGLLVFGAVGCNVHEPWPDNPVKPTPDPPVVENVPVTLNFHFDTALPLYKEISYSRGTQTLHEMRYTVQVYAPSRASASEPNITWTFRCPVSDTPDFTTGVNLPDGEYELYAWADYVDAGTITDKYYDTSSWQTLKVADIKNHQGSTEYRDAFRGFTTKTIVNSSEVTPSNTIDIAMKRPLARFEFIATDYAEFARNELAARNPATQSSDNEISPDDYTIVFFYRDFTPTGYNVFTDKPNDAVTGMQFASNISLTEKGASLGFNYIFVNGTETSVKVVLGIYDRQGQLAASTGEIEVPLVRSKNTIVKGEFLSGKSQGGVGVKPEFDGNYDIEI